MLNLTLTITAAPELLAAISNFSSAITATKVAVVPKNNSDFNFSKEQIAATYQQQNPSALQPIQAQQGIKTQQVSQAQVPTQGATVPTTVQTYTMEQLAVAATQIVDAGRSIQLVGLLNSFGVQTLTALPKVQYGAFATQLRALGAKI